jgi:hypothetical protein
VAPLTRGRGLALLMVALAGARASAQQSASHGTSPLGRACCLAPTATWPPSRDTLPTLEREGNPAGLTTRDSGATRLLEVALHRTAGTLQRPQEARAQQEGALHAEGGRLLGGWRTAGLVRYARRHDRDVRWNNSSDAYLGTPYVWADSIGGDWLRDLVSLGATIATPSWRRMSAGVRLEYGVGQGARRNGPRPLFRRRVLDLVPGVRWQLTPRQQIGLHGRVGWESEESEIGGAGSPDDPVIFRLRGLGTFDRTQLISAERALLGRRHEGTVSHAWRSTQWATSASATARLVRDSVRDGIGRPTPGGSSRRLRGDGQFAVRRVVPRGGAQLDARVTRESARGSDPSFGAVNVIDQATSMAVRWQRWRGAAPDDATRWWQVHAGASTLSRRDVVAETAWRVAAPEAGAAVLSRLGGGGTLRGWLVGASMGRRFVTDTNWRADRPTRLTPVLVRPDFAVHATPQWHGGVRLGYEWRSAGLRTRVLAEVARTTRATDAPAFATLGSRTVMQVTYSVF